MRRRHGLGILAIFAAVFVAALALTFPSDALVRLALSRALPAGGPLVFFERARLRPSGLRLDGVDVRDPDGNAAAHADWVVLRPSVAGLLGNGHTGRPWHARAATCAGTVEALVDRDPTGDVVTVSWSEIDLARCPALPSALRGVRGVAAGHARAAGGSVEGALDLRNVTLTGVLPLLPLVRADTASSRWTVAGGRLLLDGLAIRGPDLEASGGGTVALATSAAESGLDLRLTLAPGHGAPLLLRNAILLLPGAVDGSDARRIAVTGPAIAPQIVAAP